MIDFDINVAQNICFFDIANDVVDKINFIKLDIKFSDIIDKTKIFDEIKKVWIVANLFASVLNEINSLKNKINIDINFASFFW